MDLKIDARGPSYAAFLLIVAGVIAGVLFGQAFVAAGMIVLGVGWFVAKIDLDFAPLSGFVMMLSGGGLLIATVA